ncbi:MAG: BLUF domain-containing protein [Pseudomonadota bacterium]
MLYELVYSSTAVDSLEESDLEQILVESRRFNETCRMTGLLAYDGKKFFQLLEGEEQQVDTLFENIRIDPRHKDVRLFYTGNIQKRIFDDWSMAYKRLPGGLRTDEWMDAVQAGALIARLGRGFSVGCTVLRLAYDLH